MALDTENEELETEVETPDVSKDAPETKTFDRETLVSDAFAEGIEDSVIEELAAKETVTLDDLKKIPGAEELSDEQLQAAWDKAQADAGITTEPETKVELPFPVYDAQGNKIAAEKVTLEDLLGGKIQIGYQAMDKEQRKTLAEVVRNASQGHWNEHRYNTVQSQYRQSVQANTQLQNQVQEFEAQRGQWNAALTALVMNDNGPMKALVEAYRGALGKSGMAPPEGFVSQDDAREQQEATERGMQWWSDVGIPSAYDIASRYSADSKEVQGAIKWFIEKEPNLTKERIDEIIKFDVPYLLEQNGYSAKDSGIVTPSGQAPNAPQGNSEIEALKKQIEALSARLAGTGNDRTNAIREKGRKTPPAGSGATSGAGDAMPSFKTRAEMKQYLQS